MKNDAPEVLLARRYNTGYEDGKYSLPAGHVEAEESATDVLIREIAEEIGIKFTSEDLKVVHVMHRNAGSPDNERIDIFYKADWQGKWKGQLENKEPHKCDDLSWFPLDDLPEDMVPYVRKSLEHIKNGVYYSEFGW